MCSRDTSTGLPDFVPPFGLERMAPRPQASKLVGQRDDIVLLKRPNAARRHGGRHPIKGKQREGGCIPGVGRCWAEGVWLGVQWRKEGAQKQICGNGGGGEAEAMDDC